MIGIPFVSSALEMLNAARRDAAPMKTYAKSISFSSPQIANLPVTHSIICEVPSWADSNEYTKKR